MKTIDSIPFNLPTWSLSFLINGNPNGLTPNQLEDAQDWLASASRVFETLYPGCIPTVIAKDEASILTLRPAFGESCPCVRGALVALVPVDHPLPALITA